MRKRLWPSVLLASLAFAPSLVGQDWPHWRGPNFDGSTRAEDVALGFDRETGVRWKASLPGPGAGTPIVLGERVFLPAVDLGEERLLALCLDRTTGEERWRREVTSSYLPEGVGKVALDHRSNYASPSPVTDGEVVVFFYGSGDLAAFSPDGEPLWAVNLQEEHGDFAFQWTFSASPTLFEGRLYLPVLQRDQPANGRGREGAESFLLALDPKTGETLVRRARPSAARMESLESYATMIPHVAEDGRKELLVVGGDVVTGHDPETLEELWRWGTWNEGHREMWWRVVPSPVVGGGVVLACAPKREPVFAVLLGGKGDLGEDGLAWKSEGQRNPVSSDVPTPLFLDGAFFVLSDVRSALSRVAAETGEVEWTIDLPGRALWRASPTGADGKVFLLDHAGTIVVVDAKSGDVLHSAALGNEDDDLIRSTVVVAHGDVFVRTNDTLYCFGG